MRCSEWGDIRSMADYLNEEICDFDNDASASSFGWNFQSNAGIFLFLKYLKKSKSIKIESKLQDIEITMDDGRKVLAQAKSAQDYTATSDQKEKFKDAIISLAKFSSANNQLIYISNIPNTFRSASGAFNNCVVPYDTCLTSTKREIDQVFMSVIQSIKKKISESATYINREKLEKIKSKLESFDKSLLYISVVYPFFGDESNRYQAIGDSIISFLVNDIKLEHDCAVSIKQQLLEHWQLLLQYNSTIADGSVSKEISKGDFAWPITVFLSENSFPDIDDCLTFIPDNSIKKEVKQLLRSPSIIYHERFEFSNKVIQAYADYKKEKYRSEIKDIEKAFIKDCGNEFMGEFNLGYDEDFTEYLTKVFIYHIINNYHNMQKISAGIGVKL